MTAFGAVSSAVDAMRAGAAEYLTKPLNFDELLVVLDKVLEQHELRRETRQLRPASATASRRTTSSARARRCSACSRSSTRSRRARRPCCITGETGTGKELVANAIHQRSPRAGGPFVKLHCAALAETLLESELFGHERGSFTGAMARKDGRFSTRRRRHAVPRRDRRDLAVDPGQAAALPPGARVRARRRHADDPRRRARDRGHQPQPRRGGREGPVPRGSLLPAQRRLDRDAAAARSPQTTSRRSAKFFLDRYTQARTASRSRASRPRRSSCSAPTTGPATSASSRTRSSARWC